MEEDNKVHRLPPLQYNDISRSHQTVQRQLHLSNQVNVLASPKNLSKPTVEPQLFYN